MISASRSARAAASGSWSRTPSERGPGGRRGGEGVGLVLVAGERLARLLGGGAQGVGEAEAGLLGGQCGVLARLRVHGLDLAQPEAQQVGLLGAVAGRRHHLLELALGAEQPVVEPGVRREQRSQPGTRRTGPARRAGPGSAAAGAGRTGRGPRPAGRSTRGQRRHRDRCSADEGAGASLGRHGAGQDHPVVLDLAADLVDRLREARQALDPHHALDPGRAGAGADRAGVGPAAEEQPECGDDHGLAGPGLTGDHGQAGAELERRGLDHPERADPDLLKHRGPRPACVAARSSRANPRRAARTWRPAGR